MIKDASGLVYYAVLAGLQDQKAEARRCDETNRHFQLVSASINCAVV